MLVANHISWLDIFVVNTLAPAAFVCKAEVREWPAIGWLCARTETVFLPRGSRSAARETSSRIAQRLGSGWLVAVFPEGTTGDGAALLPFHGALLQAAVEAQCPVQPLALRYLHADGRHCAAPAYCGSDTLWQSLLRIAGASGVRARIEVLPALDAPDRKALAEAAHAAIAGVLSRAMGHAAPEASAASSEPAALPAA